MAKKEKPSTSSWSPNPSIKRPGVHAKSKSSKLKSSKNYIKKNVGQG
jgi:hypothetical protein